MQTPLAPTTAGMAGLLQEAPLVPVVVIDDPLDAVPAGQALLAGGIACAEITFRTDAAAEAISRMRDVQGMAVGAGTVINGEQATAAIDAGAAFLVSPGLSEDVAHVARDRGVPYLPGATSPTDIMRCLALGISTVKFFPAEAMGGLPVVKALHGPFPQVDFVPTGGIGISNLAEWLGQPFITSVGGSWMITRDQIREHAWDSITEASLSASRRAQEILG